MPSTSAARRASWASSFEQQPRAPERKDWGFFGRARCTPVTSCPASTARAAATAESTPPDMAAKTFMRFPPAPCLRGAAAILPAAGGSDERRGGAGPGDRVGQGRDQGQHVGAGAAPAEGEAQRGAGV